MQLPLAKESNILIETKDFSRVKKAVESGETPVLVLGLAGSGKTSLLLALAQYWRTSDRSSIFIPLSQIGRDDDLYRHLRREFVEYFPRLNYDDPNFVAGSSRAALRATMKILEAAPSDLLLVLDGLDEMSDPSPVLQLLDLASGSTSAKIVVASRDRFRVEHRIFRSVIVMSSLTTEDMYKFLRRSGDPPLDSTAIEFIIKNAAGSPLLVELMLGMVREYGAPVDFDVPLTIGRLIEQTVELELKNVDVEQRENYIRALTSLAVLNRPIHSSEYPASVLLKLNIKSRLTVSNDSRVTLMHPLAAQSLLSFAKLTSDSANHTLSSLEFGAEEAERDALLSDGFITLPEFADVLAGKKNIVVGDRGTGKSAMFARLSMSHNGEFLDKKLIVKPLTHPADLLRRMEANGSQLSTADEFRAGWLTLVAYCIADQVKAFSSPDHARAAIYLKEMLGNDSETGWMLLKFIKSIGGRILRSSVKIQLGPVVIEPAGKPGAAGVRASLIDLRAFIKDAADSLNDLDQMAHIPLDRVDEIQKYDRNLQQKAVQGLFLAEGDLAQLAGIRLVIFLRSDLFKVYDIQEKNKLVSRSMTIRWTKPQLLQFVVDRVLSNRCLYRLKDLIGSIPDDAHDVALAAIFPTEIEGMSTTQWLWEWMENGNGDVSPRQFILLLILAAQSPVAQQVKMDRLPIFSLDALRWGMDQLSELSFKELVDDFRVAPTFLVNCRAGRLDSFELAKVEPLFSKDEGSISVQVERLERLGFLERVVVQASDGTKSSHFEVPKLFTRSWSLA